MKRSTRRALFHLGAPGLWFQRNRITFTLVFMDNHVGWLPQLTNTQCASNNLGTDLLFHQIFNPLPYNCQIDDLGIFFQEVEALLAP